MECGFIASGSDPSGQVCLERPDNDESVCCLFEVNVNYEAVLHQLATANSLKSLSLSAD